MAAFFDIGVLSDMVNIGTLSAFTLVAISIPIMRKKRPDLPRAFKMPGSPWIPILIAVANFWLMLNLSVLTWIRFVARGRLRHLLRLRLLACAPRQGRPDRNAVRRNR